MGFDIVTRTSCEECIENFLGLGDVREFYTYLSLRIPTWESLFKRDVELGSRMYESLFK